MGEAGITGPILGLDCDVPLNDGLRAERRRRSNRNARRHGSSDELTSVRHLFILQPNDYRR